MNRRTFTIRFFQACGSFALGLVGCGEATSKSKALNAANGDGTYNPSDNTRHVVNDLVVPAQTNPFDTHTITIAANDINNPPAAGLRIVTVPGGHSVNLSQAQLRSIASGATVNQSTNTDTTGHSHTFTIKLA